MTGRWWLGEARGTAFDVHALPYGVFRTAGTAPRVGVRIGEAILDVTMVAERLEPRLAGLFAAPALNPLMAAGPVVWADARGRVAEWLQAAEHASLVGRHLHRLGTATMSLPFEPGDYVDFYSCRHHAENLGRLFRPGQPALTPNWPHLPIGYHGRSGSLVVSGTDVVRPNGQTRTGGSGPPVFAASRRLDIEAEVGFVVGVPSVLGRPVPIREAGAHVFGVTLVNDWSARDIQQWEYVPLGPFLGKSFATSVSAWVLPLAALDGARMRPPHRDVELLPYLDDRGTRWGFDIEIEVRLNGTTVSKPPFRQMYWNVAQHVAHVTANGASLRTGDLLASGTVSGPAPGERGSLIELTWNGAEPIVLKDGGRRGFLEDGDEVVITATAPAPGGGRVGLGEVRGRIRPAPSPGEND